MMGPTQAGFGAPAMATGNRSAQKCHLMQGQLAVGAAVLFNPEVHSEAMPASSSSVKTLQSLSLSGRVQICLLGLAGSLSLTTVSGI